MDTSTSSTSDSEYVETVDAVGHLADRIVGLIEASGEVEGLRLLTRCRRRLDVCEALLLAARVDPVSGDDREASRLLVAAGDDSTRGERRRRIRRAVVADEVEGVREQWASGEVSGAHLDALGDAHRARPGALADRGLVEQVCRVSPDRARQVKNDWLNRQLNADEVEAKYHRQREQRAATRGTTPAGVPSICLSGDQATIDQLWSHLVAEADRLYRADGGRDVAGHAHRRRYEQRLFDAAVAALLGQAGGSRNSGRPSVVITVDAQRLFDGDRSMPIGEQIGTGPIADNIVIEALKDADLWTLLCGPEGQPLWMGRSRRDPTRAQLIALIVRDRGCVQTGEHWRTAEAHHTPPWSSPAQGRTDIDQLMLLSPLAHRQTHAQHQTWDYHHQTARFTRRPATPDEIAPARPRRLPNATDDQPP